MDSQAVEQQQASSSRNAIKQGQLQRIEQMRTVKAKEFGLRRTDFMGERFGNLLARVKNAFHGETRETKVAIGEITQQGRALGYKYTRDAVKRLTLSEVKEYKAQQARAEALKAKVANGYKLTSEEKKDMKDLLRKQAIGEIVITASAADVIRESSSEDSQLKTDFAKIVEDARAERVKGSLTSEQVKNIVLNLPSVTKNKLIALGLLQENLQNKSTPIVSDEFAISIIAATELAGKKEVTQESIPNIMNQVAILGQVQFVRRGFEAKNEELEKTNPKRALATRRLRTWMKGGANVAGGAAIVAVAAAAHTVLPVVAAPLAAAVGRGVLRFGVMYGAEANLAKLKNAQAVWATAVKNPKSSSLQERINTAYTTLNTPAKWQGALAAGKKAALGVIAGGLGGEAVHAVFAYTPLGHVLEDHVFKPVGDAVGNFVKAHNPLNDPRLTAVRLGLANLGETAAAHTFGNLPPHDVIAAHFAVPAPQYHIMLDGPKPGQHLGFDLTQQMKDFNAGQPTTGDHWYYTIVPKDGSGVADATGALHAFHAEVHLVHIVGGHVNQEITITSDDHIDYTEGMKGIIRLDGRVNIGSNPDMFSVAQGAVGSTGAAENVGLPYSAQEMYTHAVNGDLRWVDGTYGSGDVSHFSPAFELNAAQHVYTVDEYYALVKNAGGVGNSQTIDTAVNQLNAAHLVGHDGIFIDHGNQYFFVTDSTGVTHIYNSTTALQLDVGAQGGIVGSGFHSAITTVPAETVSGNPLSLLTNQDQMASGLDYPAASSGASVGIPNAPLEPVVSRTVVDFTQFKLPATPHTAGLNLLGNPVVDSVAGALILGTAGAEAIRRGQEGKTNRFGNILARVGRIWGYPAEINAARNLNFGLRNADLVNVAEKLRRVRGKTERQSLREQLQVENPQPDTTGWFRNWRDANRARIDIARHLAAQYVDNRGIQSAMYYAEQNGGYTADNIFRGLEGELYNAAFRRSPTSADRPHPEVLHGLMNDANALHYMNLSPMNDVLTARYSRRSDAQAFEYGRVYGNALVANGNRFTGNANGSNGVNDLFAAATTAEALKKLDLRIPINKDKGWSEVFLRGAKSGAESGAAGGANWELLKQSLNNLHLNNNVSTGRFNFAVGTGKAFTDHAAVTAAIEADPYAFMKTITAIHNAGRSDLPQARYKQATEEAVLIAMRDKGQPAGAPAYHQLDEPKTTEVLQEFFPTLQATVSGGDQGGNGIPPGRKGIGVPDPAPANDLLNNTTGLGNPKSPTVPPPATNPLQGDAALGGDAGNVPPSVPPPADAGEEKVKTDLTYPFTKEELNDLPNLFEIPDGAYARGISGINDSPIKKLSRGDIFSGENTLTRETVNYMLRQGLVPEDVRDLYVQELVTLSDANAALADAYNGLDLGAGHVKRSDKAGIDAVNSRKSPYNPQREAITILQGDQEAQFRLQLDRAGAGATRIPFTQLLQKIIGNNFVNYDALKILKANGYSDEELKFLVEIEQANFEDLTIVTNLF